MWDSVPRPEGVESLGTGVGSQPAPELPPIPREREEEWQRAQDYKNKALVCAREVLSGWINSREEAVLTALLTFLSVKHEYELRNLNDRLMGKYGLRWEISRLAELEGLSLREAAARVPDSLRYIVLVSETEYTRVVCRTIADIEKNDQELAWVRNHWTAHAAPDAADTSAAAESAAESQGAKEPGEEAAVADEAGADGSDGGGVGGPDGAAGEAGKAPAQDEACGEATGDTRWPDDDERSSPMRFVEAVFRSPGGRLFRVSFHTDASLDLRLRVKRRNDARLQLDDGDPHLAAAEAEVVAALTSVAVPPDAGRISLANLALLSTA